MTKTERAVFKIHIEGSIEAVWREITKTDEPQQCFFNMQLHTPGLAPDAPIRMRTKNGKYTGVVGKVLEFDPPNRYSHTFKFTQFDDPECTVRYELEEIAGGVQFTLIIDDLPVGTKTGKQMAQGGKMIVNTLKAIVENGRPSVGTRLLFVLFRLLEPLSPKKTRSINWPLSRKEIQDP